MESLSCSDRFMAKLACSKCRMFSCVDQIEMIDNLHDGVLNFKCDIQFVYI